MIRQINTNFQQRPTPPQFFPWNRPVAASLLQDNQNNRFQNQQGPPLQQFRNDPPPPTTLAPPLPSLSTPCSLNCNQQQTFFDNPTPLAPLSNDNQYRDFNSINDPQRPFGNNQGLYPPQQNQVIFILINIQTSKSIIYILAYDFSNSRRKRYC